LTAVGHFIQWELKRPDRGIGGQVSVALQLNAIFEFNQQSQQLKADFMLISNWTDPRRPSPDPTPPVCSLLKCSRSSCMRRAGVQME
jgi:hypothetical protein